MNRSNSFDERVRRKLAEQQFPFEEADWQAVRRAIDADRRRRPAGPWMLAGLLLLLIGSATWWWSTDASHPLTATNTTQEAQPQKVAAQQASAIGPTVGEGRPAPTEQALPIQEKPTHHAHTSSSSHPVEQGARTGSSARSDRSVVAPRAAHGAADTGITPALITEVATIDEAEKVPAPEEKQRPTASSNTAVQAPATDNVTTVLVHPDRTGLDASASDTPSPAITASAADKEVDRGLPATSEQGGENAPSIAVTATSQAVDRPATVASSEGSTMAATPADSVNAMVPPTDSAQAVPALQPVLPSIDARSPWEITAWAGGLSSTVHYTGAASADWNASSTSARSSAFGAELMHMGRHIGLGTGIHYVTYAEQLDAAAIDRLTSSTQRQYFLTPVDTSIFFVTDTIQQGGQFVFAGVSRDTTVFVLDSRLETTTTTTRQREAREVINRVSYVEVPLLLDAHTASGRWSFGVIGGPTIGLLSGRKGLLPNATNDGYTALDDRAFHSLMFGYTARVYVRFRMGDHWSLGLEPSLRGQLASAVEGDALTRRTQALGGALSFTYRLP